MIIRSCLFWHCSINYLVVIAEQAGEERFGLFRAYMDAQLVIVFPEEKDVGTEDESNHPVELKNRINASFKKPAEWVEFVKIIDHNFHVVRR